MPGLTVWRGRPSRERPAECSGLKWEGGRSRLQMPKGSPTPNRGLPGWALKDAWESSRRARSVPV